MSKAYSAEAIQVLTGLEPVRKRPGMYTDTSRPNHLVQEVVDNSVDEALAGHCQRIDVRLHADGSIEVEDDGRGMPVDVHPQHGVTGVELILTRLHAGGKFDDTQYRFSGGLHGVGVSVVNALSAWLDVEVKRDGSIHRMRFEGGEKVTELAVTGSVGRRNTGTRIRFLPDPRYFDSPRVAVPRLEHLLRAKAVLCHGLTVTLAQDGGEPTVWAYADGLGSYLQDALAGQPVVPAAPVVHATGGSGESAEWALQWLTDGAPPVTESYVNLIPTPQGGTHVNGLRAGLTEAMREFCEFRDLLPRGVRLAPEDVFDHVAYVLSVKLRDPQFTGQTKDRLSSRECAAFVAGLAKDAFSLYLNQHTDDALQVAGTVIASAQRRLQESRKVARKQVTGSGPALPGKLVDCAAGDPRRAELFLVEGDSAGGSARQARDREFQAVLPLRGKILNTWEVASDEILASQEVHDIAVAIGVDPGARDLAKLRYHRVCILADADSDGLHIATLLSALFVRHFPALVAAGHVYVAMPPLYRIDVGKEVHYALDDAERDGILKSIETGRRRGKVTVQRFKGLGEMNPLQLRETTMAPETRRLVRLDVDSETATHELLDMLLARKRAGDRREWLEAKGDLAAL
jgi:topoisomerase-4 subunit B